MRIRTAGDLAAVARGRRLDLGWTQAETAGRAGVSRKWLSDLETGKATVDLGVVGERTALNPAGGRRAASRVSGEPLAGAGRRFSG